MATRVANGVLGNQGVRVLSGNHDNISWEIFKYSPVMRRDPAYKITILTPSFLLHSSL